MSIAMRRIFGLLLAVLVIAVDQASKAAVLRFTNIHFPVEILPIFRIAYTENYGISLGLLAANTLELRWLLLAVTIAIAVGVLWWMFRERRLGDVLALGLVLGGAAGNIADRMNRGYVVDFLDLHFGDWRPFMIFNVADAAITIGVVIVLARSLFWGEKPDAAAPTATET